MHYMIYPKFRYNKLFTSHERVCTKDYKIPGTDIVVPTGRIVHVFFESIISSKDTFIDPDNFNPENFNPDHFTNKFADQAFGQGPRACPGSNLRLLVNLLSFIIPGTRYAYLAVKLFLVKFFSKYKVKSSEKTNRTLEVIVKKSYFFVGMV